MKRIATAIGFALALVIVWCIFGFVAALVHAIFAQPEPPKHRVTWLVSR